MTIFKQERKPDISVIVPVVERYDDLRKVFVEYSEPFRKIGKGFEFIFVVDGGFNKAYEELKSLKNEFNEIKIIKFARNFFESIALMTGIEHARGDIIFTLSAYFQVEPNAINEIMVQLKKGYDLIITRRFPRRDNILNRIQASSFNLLVRKITACSFRDIASGLRGMKSEVAKSLELTGDMHRFIPILAYQKGYKVLEINAAQRAEDKKLRFYGLGTYTRRFIDIVTLFFLIKFTRKPLRFFGLIGINLFSVGAVITGYLAYVRLFMSQGIAGRPLLLLGLLLMVLGIQIASLGLLGELIIFTHARDIKEYHIGEIIE